VVLKGEQTDMESELIQPKSEEKERYENQRENKTRRKQETLKFLSNNILSE